jgi:hypothetical protein
MAYKHEAFGVSNWTNVPMCNYAREYNAMPHMGKCHEKENAVMCGLPPTDPKAKPEPHPSKYKTELCKNYEEKGFCSYGTKCRFAHGVDELNYKDKQNCKYKSRPCQSFFTSLYCPYGNRCLFKHDERTLAEITKSYYVYLLQYPALREQAPKRRLPVFDELLDTEETVLNNIYRTQSKTITKILEEDDIVFPKKCRELSLNFHLDEQVSP